MSSEIAQSYFKASSGKVSYSRQIHTDVIADYDARGGVVGLEFLSVAVASQREKYLALANQQTMGAMKPARPPELGTVAAAPRSRVA